MASAIDFLASHEVNINRKGVIHCGSFKAGYELWSRLSGRERYIYQQPAQGQRMKALKEFEESSKPVILITPSFTTGLDLPGVIDWQVISKVPFGNLGDPIVRMRRDTVIGGKAFGKLNYDAEAMNTVVQACGRAVRGADDKGVTYILDGNFWGLYKRSYSPGYFKEEVREMVR